jgi:hypothetical protein
MHAHPNYLVYSLADATVTVTEASGQTIDVDLQAGQAMWREAEEHSAKNNGSADVVALLFELNSFTPYNERRPGRLAGAPRSVLLDPHAEEAQDDEDDGDGAEDFGGNLCRVPTTHNTRLTVGCCAVLGVPSSPVYLG